MEAFSAINATQEVLHLPPPDDRYDPNAGPITPDLPTPVFEGVNFPEDPIRLLSVQVVLILAYSTIIVLGVLGNSLVIYVIYRFKTLRTVTNFFIANLAVADLLVNTLCLPFTLVYTLQGEWKFGRTLCFLLPYAQGLAVHVSTVTLNVIALDRHRCIVYHLDTRMRKDVCFGVIAWTWVLSAVLASPLAIFREYGSFSLEPGHTMQVFLFTFINVKSIHPQTEIFYFCIFLTFKCSRSSNECLYLLNVVQIQLRTRDDLLKVC
uniref:Neuropeptide Y receptor type 2 n=1 Tax=Acanthochromis polyacanthus TaxID=80966 RepID=A0A3Q1GSR9_9TELE